MRNVNEHRVFYSPAKHCTAIVKANHPLLNDPAEFIDMRLALLYRKCRERSSQQPTKQ